MTERARRVLGLDILPGSSPQGAELLFALALVEDGRVVLKAERVSLEEALRLAAEKEVDVIAVDNVYELARDARELASILSRMPGKIPRLVEVTRIGDSNVSIEALCALSGLCEGKPGPLETAEAVALLAYNGVGSEALLFEEETKIVVGRGRVPGQGGMSRERFKRNLELLVKRKVLEIKDQLDKAGLDYDLFLRHGGRGLVGATFIVYAPRERLNGLVKQESGHDLFVEISPVRRDSLAYRPLVRAEQRALRGERYLIVGVDPGMSTGVAVLDFQGDLVSVFSRRLLGRSQLMRLLLQLGRPVVVAVDVNPPPVYARKLAAQTGALLFVPERSMSVEEKRRITSGYPVEDTHQRDALAAALKAFNEYKAKFEEVEKEAARYNLPVSLEYAKYLVLRGRPVSTAVREAVKEYLRLTPREEYALSEVTQESASEQLKFYRRLVERLLSENRALQAELRELSGRAAELEMTVKKLLNIRRDFSKRDLDYLKMSRVVDELRGEVSSLKAQLEAAKFNVDSLARVLVDAALGRTALALKISYVMEEYRDRLGELRGKLARHVLFLDKSYPSDVLRRVLLELKEPSCPLVIITRSEGEAATLEEALPVGACAVPLEKLGGFVETEHLIAVDAERLARALRELSSDEEKIKSLLEEYRRERMMALEGSRVRRS